VEASDAQLNLPDPDVHIPYKVVTPGEPRQELVGKRFVDVMEVSYETPSGVVDHLVIPAAEYNPAAVDRAIQEKLHRSEGVAALGAVPHPENLQT
jgi:hypothetical protein